MDGFRLGRYRLESKLAAGGMAEIWLARQEGPAGFSKLLVIKRILPHLALDRAFVDMFLQEGRLAAMINNPHVVQVFELGADGGDYYLVMEHVPGWSLRAILNRALELGRPIPDACIAHLAIGACLGLHAAHELLDAHGQPVGLVHRDVSPDNVLVTRGGQAKVTDFGIAKATASVSSTQPGTMKGKLAYMPPEQLLGKTLDRRADIYAMGVTLFELLSFGKKPLHVPADAALSLAILEEKPLLLRVLRPDVPPPLEALCARALEKDPTRRPPGAMAVVRELEAYVATTGVSPTAVGDYLAELFPRDEPTPMPSAPQPGTAKLAPAPDAAATELAARLPAAAPRRWPVALGAAVLATAAGVGFAFRFHSSAEPPVAARAAGPVVEVAPPPVVEVAPPPVVEVAPVESPAAPPVKKPRLAGRGKLLVRVNPWGDVVVDGQVMGQTPLRPFELPAGRHTVSATNSELKKSKSVTVEVRGGRQELVEINLLQ